MLYKTGCSVCRAFSFLFLDPRGSPASLDAGFLGCYLCLKITFFHWAAATQATGKTGLVLDHFSQTKGGIILSK